MAEVNEEENVPEEIEDQCLECHMALGSVERLLKPLLATTHGAMEEKMTPLENATLTLLVTYTINSMFWVYLNTKGVSPKTHPLKTELDRIQKYMQKATVLTQKSKGEVPKINKDAAKRFVRSALWDEGESSRKRSKVEDNSSNSSKEKNQ